MRNTVAERKANVFKKIKEYILKHSIDDVVNEDDPFFFNL